MSENSVDSDYDTMLDEDQVTDETLIAGTTYYKSKKNSATVDHLSKMWKISQEDAQLTIDNATQRCVRQADPSTKRNYGIKQGDMFPGTLGNRDCSPSPPKSFGEREQFPKFPKIIWGTFWGTLGNRRAINW